MKLSWKHIGVDDATEDPGKWVVEVIKGAREFYSGESKEPTREDLVKYLAEEIADESGGEPAEYLQEAEKLYNQFVEFKLSWKHVDESEYIVNNIHELRMKAKPGQVWKSNRQDYPYIVCVTIPGRGDVCGAFAKNKSEIQQIQAHPEAYATGLSLFTENYPMTLITDGLETLSWKTVNQARETDRIPSSAIKYSWKNVSSPLYDVTAYSTDRKTGKKNGPTRTERVNVTTNGLFNGNYSSLWVAKNEKDVKTIYESWWNDLNEESKDVVVVTSVVRVLAEEEDPNHRDEHAYDVKGPYKGKQKRADMNIIINDPQTEDAILQTILNNVFPPDGESMSGNPDLGLHAGDTDEFEIVNDKADDLERSHSGPSEEAKYNMRKDLSQENHDTETTKSKETKHKGHEGKKDKKESSLFSYHKSPTVVFSIIKNERGGYVLEDGATLPKGFQYRFGKQMMHPVTQVVGIQGRLKTSPPTWTPQMFAVRAAMKVIAADYNRFKQFILMHLHGGKDIDAYYKIDRAKDASEVIQILRTSFGDEEAYYVLGRYIDLTSGVDTMAITPSAAKAASILVWDEKKKEITNVFNDNEFTITHLASQLVEEELGGGPWGKIAWKNVDTASAIAQELRDSLFLLSMKWRYDEEITSNADVDQSKPHSIYSAFRNEDSSTYIAGAFVDNDGKAFIDVTDDNGTYFLNKQCSTIEEAMEILSGIIKQQPKQITSSLETTAAKAKPQMRTTRSGDEEFVRCPHCDKKHDLKWIKGYETTCDGCGMWFEIDRSQDFQNRTRTRPRIAGTWSGPTTIMKARQLMKWTTLLNGMIPTSEATSRLYNLIGDDALFDAIEDNGTVTEGATGKVIEARLLRTMIKTKVKEQLQSLAEGRWNGEWDEAAVALLQAWIAEPVMAGLQNEDQDIIEEFDSGYVDKSAGVSAMSKYLEEYYPHRTQDAQKLYQMWRKKSGAPVGYGSKLSWKDVDTYPRVVDAPKHEWQKYFDFFSYLWTHPYAAAAVDMVFPELDGKKELIQEIYNAWQLAGGSKLPRAPKQETSSLYSQAWKNVVPVAPSFEVMKQALKDNHISQLMSEDFSEAGLSKDQAIEKANEMTEEWFEELTEQEVVEEYKKLYPSSTKSSFYSQASLHVDAAYNTDMRNPEWTNNVIVEAYGQAQLDGVKNPGEQFMINAIADAIAKHQGMVSGYKETDNLIDEAKQFHDEWLEWFKNKTKIASLQKKAGERNSTQSFVVTVKDGADTKESMWMAISQIARKLFTAEEQQAVSFDVALSSKDTETLFEERDVTFTITINGPRELITRLVEGILTAMPQTKIASLQKRASGGDSTQFEKKLPNGYVVRVIGWHETWSYKYEDGETSFRVDVEHPNVEDSITLYYSPTEAGSYTDLKDSRYQDRIMRWVDIAIDRYTNKPKPEYVPRREDQLMNRDEILKLRKGKSSMKQITATYHLRMPSQNGRVYFQRFANELNTATRSSNIHISVARIADDNQSAIITATMDKPVVKETVARLDALENVLASRYMLQREPVLSLVKQADDISDRVPPMGWQQDSQMPAGNPGGQGAQPALPPNQQIAQPIYDSNKDQGKKFNITVDPNDKSVNVKFLNSEEEDALNNALDNASPTANPAGSPQYDKGVIPDLAFRQQGQGVPGQGTPAPAFNDQQTQTSF